MASLRTSAPPSYSIGISRRPSAATATYAPFFNRLTPSCRNYNDTPNSRLKKELKLQAKKRWSHVSSASNTNPSEKSDDTKSKGEAPGPPLLTILAGVVVFLFISWILGSIVMWIIGIILHPPLPK